MRATDDAQWNTAVNQGKYICSYNAKNDPGNKFQFYTLDAESVAAFEEAVKQDAHIVDVVETDAGYGTFQ